MEMAARRAGPLSDASSPAVVAWRVQRRQYFTLLQQKRSDFWKNRVDVERLRPRRLWRSFDELLGRGRAPLSLDVDASALHRFFDDKVAGVRASTAGADSPTFTPVPVGCELRLFTPIAPADVVELVRKLPDKQCTSDPIPTWLMKLSVEVLAPFLCRLFNWSLQSGIVPSTFKSAYITPLLKKADLDPADTKSYRPISNLSVTSKLLERLISKELLRYLKNNDLLPDLQSAY